MVTLPSTITHANPKILDDQLNQIANTKSAEDQKFELLAEDIWQDALKRNPLSAVRFGLDSSPDEMPDISLEALQAANNNIRQQLALLNDIQAAKLSEQNRINLTILQHRLNNEADQFDYQAYQVPLTAEGGFHTSLGFLPSAIELKSLQDAKNYLSRMADFPSYFAQHMSHMKQGIKQGNTQPQVVLQGFESSIDGFIVDKPEDSVFFAPFKELSFLTEQQQTEIKQLAAQVITNQVVPAYQSFRDFMSEEYIPNSRKSIGVQYIPNGKSYYQNRSDHYTTTDLSAQEIHEIGLSEVKRIRAEMQTIIDQLEFDGSFAEFLTFLRSDPQFYATTPEQLLKEASFIAKKMDAQLPKLFYHLPRTPYGIAPVPDHIAPKYTTGRYISPNKDTDPGYYWVNTYALDRRPLYELEALTLHEAVPGHHLQISLTREMSNTPLYRSSYYMSAFGEGWGLYAEWLGLEAGFYQDPYSNFGRLTYEMWRALRLAVDTGMHVMDWTRDQAIEFMKQNSALSEHNITTEVDRYISWPGQALSYKIGELTIKRLRAEAEAQLGQQFDVREFHYHVLKNGSVPLSLLEQQVKMYIQEKLRQVPLTK
ncbi:MAG: DUF885 domain-containing protein [Gammaproteobacteria bacterium]|nr:DUF885 domain-containing protein [Gammaproteobacteria bacterium]